MLEDDLPIVGEQTRALGRSCVSIGALSVSRTVSGDQDLAALVTIKPTI